MASSWATVNKFRLWVVVSLSFATSLGTIAGSQHLSGWDIVQTVAQMCIAALAFLQCPSDGK